MDWNWFFSSIAQSMAAIVGIFSAFVITKVINNQNEFARKRIKLKELLFASERLQEAFSKRYIPWLSEERLESSIARLEKRLEKGEHESAEDFYSSIGFPVYLRRTDVLSKIQDVMDRFVPESERPKRSYSVYDSIAMVKSEGQIQRDFERNQQKWRELDEEEERINSLVVETRHHMKTADFHLLEIQENPESSGLVTASIGSAAVLFLFGVIYPLSFLPAGSEIPQLSVWQFFSILFSFKGLMLAIPVAIFCGILSVFAAVNFSLRYNTDDVQALNNAAHLGNYSEHLQIMEENINEQLAYIENKQKGAE